MTKFIASALTSALALGSAVVPGTSQAQKIEGPLKIIVGYSPGGASDRAARLVGDALRDKLGVTVVVENKTGAGGRIAAQSFKTTPASENALMIGNPAINVVAPIVYKEAGYDPHKDFVPVAHVTNYDFGVAVGPNHPAKTMAELMSWLKANPQQANFGVPATGSLPHFFALMLADTAKVSAQVVGYRGSAPLITDVIGGQVPVGVDTLDSLAPQHAGGKLRMLAVSGDKRNADAKDVPTLREQGIDLAADGWNAFFAPASMPADRVKLLGNAIRELMADPQMQAKFRAANMEPVVAGPDETAKMLAAFRAKWEPVVKKSGLQQ